MVLDVTTERFYVLKHASVPWKETSFCYEDPRVVSVPWMGYLSNKDPAEAPVSILTGFFIPVICIIYMYFVISFA